MDNHLSRRERAALLTSQAKILSEFAALQAKVEEVGPALSSLSHCMKWKHHF
jgi:hypothetical protein